MIEPNCMCDKHFGELFEIYLQRERQRRFFESREHFSKCRDAEIKRLKDKIQSLKVKLKSTKQEKWIN